jgi:hypothetical protein
MPKLCPKIILEGTRLTNKTDTAFALNRSERLVGTRKYEYHSPLISGEWCGFTNQPWGRGLINFLPEEEGLALDTFETWVHLMENLRYYSWIIDRFHLSTRVFQRLHHGRDYDFGAIEGRLAAIGFVLVFLYRSPESFADARAERLKVSGNPAQYDDLSVFVREQEAFQDILADTRLPLLRVDISDRSIPEIVAEIAGYMESSGRLIADY